MRSEYNRGGLKLYVDHGGGLLTTYHHLGRALVRVGDEVAGGQPIALSGYSGLDALVAFPWVAPHVHFNVLLNGVVIDPFAADGEISVWDTGDNSPRPARQSGHGFRATRFDRARVDALLGDMRDPRDRARMAAFDDLHQRAWELVIESFTYPTRFHTPEAGRLLFDEVERAPRLALPFAADDFDGIAFADDAGLRR
jgi:murein DD-endopeptidase